MPLYSTASVLTVEEEDANPSVASVTKIQVSNGKLTNDGGGTVSLDLSGSAVASGTLIEVDYVEFTSGVTPTHTTEATADTVVTANALAGDGTTKYTIEFFCPRVVLGSAIADYVAIFLYDGASSIGQIGLVQDPSVSADRVPTYLVRRLTPSNASHTYSVRAAVNASNGQILEAGAGGNGNIMPGFIRIIKITT